MSNPNIRVEKIYHIGDKTVKAVIPSEMMNEVFDVFNEPPTKEDWAGLREYRIKNGWSLEPTTSGLDDNSFRVLEDAE